MHAAPHLLHVWPFHVFDFLDFTVIEQVDVDRGFADFALVYSALDWCNSSLLHKTTVATVLSL